MHLTKMKAAVFYKPYEIRIENIEKPIPKKGQVLIKVKSASICGTDIQIFTGESVINTPIVLGHDFSGIIAEIGPDIDKFSVGDRVIAHPIGYCGNCHFCLRGHFNLCLNGEWFGFEKNGGFSEYILVNNYNLLRIPNSLSFDEAATIEPVAVGLRTIKLAEPQLGDTIAIIGQGPIGLIQTQLFKHMGLNVIGIDIEAQRRQLAKKLGADQVFNALIKEELIKNIFSATEELGVDIVIEASGTQEGIDLSSEIVIPGGRIMMVGHKKNLRGPIIRLDKELILKYVELSPLEYELALRLVSDKTIDIMSLITHHICLEDLPKYLIEIAKKKNKFVKVIVNP